MRELKQDLEHLSIPRRIVLSGAIVGYAPDQELLVGLLKLGIRAGKSFSEANARGDRMAVAEGLLFWHEWFGVLNQALRRAYGEKEVMGKPLPIFEGDASEALLKLLLHLLNLSVRAGADLAQRNQESIAAFLLAYGREGEVSIYREYLERSPEPIRNFLEAAVGESREVRRRSVEVQAGREALAENEDV